MSEVIFTAPTSGLYSYNEEIFFELSKGDKYVGLPKVQLDALRVRVDELEKENQKLKEALKVAVEALELAVKSGEFFSRHADCRKESWSCRCEFCKDNSAFKNLREARQALEKVKSE